jgi:hypothetical protein
MACSGSAFYPLAERNFLKYLKMHFSIKLCAHNKIQIQLLQCDIYIYIINGIQTVLIDRINKSKFDND